MSYALVQVPEIQSLVAYIEGLGGDLSGDFLDTPEDELYWKTRPKIDKLTTEANRCLRAAFNDYYGVDPRLTNNETLDSVGDAIAIELAISAREGLSTIYATLQSRGYNVSYHSYPVVLSRSGDILLEVVT